MNREPFEMAWDPELEPERYELAEKPLYRFETGRREFIELLGGGILLLLALPRGIGELDAQESGQIGRAHV